MSELTEETNEFIKLIKNKDNLSSIKDYYNTNKDNIDISANNDYIFRNICENNNIELVKFIYPLHLWNLKVEQDEDLIDSYQDAFMFCCNSGYLEIAQWILKVELNNNFDNNTDLQYKYRARKKSCSSVVLFNSNKIYNEKVCDYISRHL